VPVLTSRRSFAYDRRLLVNPYLARFEEASHDLPSAVSRTGLSIGYPAWNLLYYVLVCGLSCDRPVLVETGTHLGFSTIVLAQALADAGVDGVVRTVDVDPAAVEVAREHARRAGVAERVRFAVGDSLPFLRDLAAEVDRVDFAFLDGDHDVARVLAEFALVHPLVAACGGRVYFDNTSSGGVAEALRRIRARYGGNLVEFANCSWAPPGNAVWAP
jgi:SAM-dependent methyltransferase